jgi:hypothetical protein
VRGRADDHEDFLRATLRHADLLHTLALRLAPHPADAADIVQETYLRAYAAWARRRPDDVGAWLATICLNAGRDELRRHARRSVVFYDGPVPDLPGRADTAEAALERLGTSRVKAALWGLPESQADRDHPDGPVRIHRRASRSYHRRPARDHPGPGAPRAQGARAQPARRTPARQPPGAAMNHDPEQLAAAYLSGMRSRACRRFEDHLLACEPCWQEVSLARRGRQLAETARDAAPAQLREDIRAAVTVAATNPAPSPRPLRRSLAAVAIAVAVLAGTAVSVRPWPYSRPASAAPAAVIAAAVTSYRDGRLPGTAVPAEPAPNLTPLHLRLAGAAAGRLDGVAVTMFAYSTPLRGTADPRPQQPAIPRSHPGARTRRDRRCLDGAVRRGDRHLRARHPRHAPARHGRSPRTPSRGTPERHLAGAREHLGPVPAHAAQPPHPAT